MTERLQMMLGSSDEGMVQLALYALKETMKYEEMIVLDKYILYFHLFLMLSQEGDIEWELRRKHHYNMPFVRDPTKLLKLVPNAPR